MIHIGIDPGTNTGLAMWDGGKFTRIETFYIHTALLLVLDIRNAGPIKVWVEDARKSVLPKHLRGSFREQGAGSIKRDSAIWAAFLEDYNIEHVLCSPQKAPKYMGKKGKEMTNDEFCKLVGWSGRTSEHARDAAMLVWKR